VTWIGHPDFWQGFYTYYAISIKHKTMATSNVKQIGKGNTEVKPVHSTWEVMKPFVHFGLKATGLIASALITIVKNIPKPDNHNQPDGKRNKVIKI
jgi:hypothetical protein